MPNPNVTRRGNVIYLRIQNDWYEYDETASPVGAGAMGVVYLGKNCNNGQRVAIKMVREQYANNLEIRGRAKQEASLRFMHSNLIEMLGYCERYPQQGPLWIVSKYVQGITIDKFVRSQNYPSGQRTNHIVRMFYPVLDALSYLHGRNICHLDIKPSNIMVEGGRNVRVLDLGIANTATGIIAGSTDGQRSHGYMGTPNYAAPEQFSYGTKLTAATDIYEAGVSLYELLTNKNPFAAHTLHETMEKHRTICLPPHKNVPAALLKVLRKATSSQPSLRYQSAQDFKSALAKALQPTSSPPVWLWIGLAIGICLFLTLTLLTCYIRMR